MATNFKEGEKSITAAKHMYINNYIDIYHK